ncbi:helix-turn-helix domain-containing protein [Sporomusa termitida]|uniref:Homeodomain-like domain protein n=1 Tax=Sporomusa termitida TaxID=2377 RepID=A0A517DSD0_9FIRM|nr:helix-turn-helix domain-containing protein [Sporomusa termitida]QDR80272.1 Homeodomain-like domain protein [Sporomusa termitida]
MNKKYHVKLSDIERTTIQKILDNETTSKYIRKRCNVLLHTDENAGKPPKQEEIAKRCGVSDVTVYSLVKEYDTQGMEYCLRRRKYATPPNPPIVTGEKEARIIALACGAAPHGRARWTVRLLAQKVIELGIMETVSHETIRTALKKHNLSLT